MANNCSGRSNKTKFFLLMLLGFALIIQPNPSVWAGDAGQLGQLYDLGPGAHATGMGGAGAAMGDDISTLYYNPAAAPFLNYSGANVSQSELFVDTKFQSGSVLINNQRWALGVSYLHLGSDDFKSYDRDGTVINAFDVGEEAYLLSGGYKLTPWFSLGVTLNHFNQNIYKHDRSSSGLDGSAFFKPFSWWRVGFTAHNIVEPTLDDEKVPLKYRVGTSIWLWEEQIRFAVDMINMDERDNRYFWGLEFYDARDWPFERTLSLRAGQADEYLTVGASLTVGRSFKFDYSIRDHDVDYIHQFGLNYFWDIDRSDEDIEDFEDEVETEAFPPLPILVSSISPSQPEENIVTADKIHRVVLPPVTSSETDTISAEDELAKLQPAPSEAALAGPDTYSAEYLSKTADDFVTETPPAAETSRETEPEADVGEELYKKHNQIRRALNSGELDRASDLIREAHALQPGHPENRRLQESLERAYEQLPANEQRARELYSEGLAHYVNGDYELAQQNWFRCLELDPGYEAPRRAIERTRALLD